MADRIVLHVGAMKSGTSYLQAQLFANQERLARGGVLVPGEAWSDQARAVRQALAPARGGGRSHWDAFAEQVRAHPGGAAVSMEFLGPIGPAKATSFLETLGFRETLGAPEVQVVLTVRDLNRTLASMWQETVQNGRSWTWAEYVADARDKRPGHGDGVSDRSSAGGTFWRQQHVVRMAATWSSLVGQENVVLVTVPQPGADRSTLARRFAAATGLDLDVETRVSTANESLGLASILVLRRVNELLDEQGLEFPAGSRLRKRTLAKTVLAARRADEPALGLPVVDWVREQTSATVAALQVAGTRLVGDWDDLTPVDVPGIDPVQVPESEILEAALAGLAGLIAEQTSS